MRRPAQARAIASRFAHGVNTRVRSYSIQSVKVGVKPSVFGKSYRSERMMKTHGNSVVLMSAWREAHGSVLRGLEPLDRLGDSLHGLGTGVLVAAAGDPSQRVVVNASATGNDLPSAVALLRLQRGDDLIKLHSPILGVCALDVKAPAPNSSTPSARHSSGMPKTPTPAKTAFQENLRNLIGERSVLAWANEHKLEQTTIQRLVNGADPKLSMVLRIAEKVGVSPAELVSPGLVVADRPALQQTIQDLESKLSDMLESTKAARESLIQQAIHSDESAHIDEHAGGNSQFGGLTEDQPEARRERKQ